jgi:hypothetical protein
MKKISNSDYKYDSIIDYDYQLYNSCEESGCNDEGICRCGVISDVQITKVDIDLFSESIYKSYYGNDKASIRNAQINTVIFGTGKELDIYTIDRILRIHKVWESYNWNINIVNGYYGQEISDITLDETIRQKIESCINTALDISEFDKRVEYLLNLEYGFILPELEGCRYSIVDIPKNEIKIGSEGHSKMVESKNLSHYKNYNGIKGIVLFNDKKHDKPYRLIDGYHRVISTNNLNVRVIKAEK